MSEIKLKPCLFCGSHKVSVVNVAEYGCFNIVKCNNCGCNTSGKSDEHESSVIKKWNTRKPMERILTRLEEVRQKYQRLQKEQGEKEDEAMNIHFRGMMDIVKEVGGICE